jgi:hypothetical protein
MHILQKKAIHKCLQLALPFLTAAFIADLPFVLTDKWILKGSDDSV